MLDLDESGPTREELAERKCQEPLDLSPPTRKAFADRQARLIHGWATPEGNRWPLTRWYNDEDFCRAYWTACQQADELAAARARVAELEAEVERLRSGGRYIATCLGGASCGRGGWTREEVRRLFEHVCREWPEFNPRLTAEAAKEGP